MKDKMVLQAKTIIEEHIENSNFSIDQLCQEIGLSRSQLHRKLKKETGLSTSLFIRQVKLEKASFLLTNTQLNISEIGYKIGFTSPQNFTKYFKAAYGLNPSKYRKQALAEKETIEKKEQITEKEEVIAITTTTSPLNSPSADQSPLPKKRSIFQLSTMLFLFFLLSGLIFLYAQSNTTITENKPPFIAVLPFIQTGLSADNYLGEGIAEDILIQLTKYDGLRIISKSTTFKYLSETSAFHEDVKALGGTHILEGEIKLINQEYRISVHLIRLSDNREIWSERFFRTEQDLVNLSSEIAMTIAQKLNQPTLKKIDQTIINPPNITAYNAYLRGNHLIRDRNVIKLKQGLAEFDKALKINPDYTDAFIAKATAILLLEDQYSVNYLTEVEQMMLKVIRQQKDKGEAYALLGNVYSNQYQFVKSLTFFEIALEYLPNNAMINYWYSLRLRTLGDFEAAIKYGKKATDLDPLHPLINAGYIYTVIVAEKYQLAEELLSTSAPIFKDTYLYLLVKGRLEIQQKNYQKALVSLNKSLALNPDFDLTIIDRFYCLVKLGRMEEVEAYLATLDENDYTNSKAFAIIYGGMNEIEKGIHYLNKGAKEGFVSGDILIDHYYQPYRNHPAYPAILQKFGLKEFSKR